jgi:integrase
MASEKLTATQVQNKRKPGFYGDGGSLWLQVTKSPKGVISKSWLFRYKRQAIAGGKARKMGLGPYPAISLAQAREKAREALRLILEGVDPIADRNARRIAAQLEAARTKTFRQCAAEYIKDQEASWKNEKHRKQWTNTLASYAYPNFGNFPVSEIDLPLVLKAIKPIWYERTETADRVRQRIEAVLDWATAHKFRTGDNPARWEGNLKNLLPAKDRLRKTKHLPALPYTELPDFMSTLRAQTGISARTLEFCILNATRTTETLRARWDEIDLENKVWTIPADRMKAGIEHRIPLSDRVVEILQGLPREPRNDFVFIGMRGKSLSHDAMLKVLRRMGGSTSVHGFRSTFRDWASETTSFPHEICEMALAHAIANKTEKAYRRGDLFEKRRRLMRDWAHYCSKPSTSAANVVAIREPQHA